MIDTFYYSNVRCNKNYIKYKNLIFVIFKITDINLLIYLIIKSDVKMIIMGNNMRGGYYYI